MPMPDHPLLDEKAIELNDQFRDARFRNWRYIEMLRDQAFQLRLEAEVKDRVATRMVNEINEDMPQEDDPQPVVNPPAA